eukprot:m.181569 g.181569  ORF g.181569 m.181569 type:complete len:58 (+) comp18041_c1_seq1:1025-1198(+)
MTAEAMRRWQGVAVKTLLCQLYPCPPQPLVQVQPSPMAAAHPLLLPRNTGNKEQQMV